MDHSDRFSEIAFYIGAASLAGAVVTALFRRTEDVPAERRASAMARLAVSILWGSVPSRCAVASIAAGLLTFAGTLVVGLALTILVLCFVPRSVQNPIEAYEGIGDAISYILSLGVGAIIAMLVAPIVGLIAGERVALRLRVTSAPKQAPQRTSATDD